MRADAPTALHQLPTQQRRILEVIDHWWRATGEPCPGTYLARRLALHHSTVQKHIGALHRHGWLRSSSAPAHLVRFID